MSSRTKKDRLEHPSAKKRIPYSCVLEFLYTCILKSQRLFMPNKPNFKLSKITASNFLNMTSAYCPRPTACKNKANHTNPAKRQYSLHGKHDPGRHPERRAGRDAVAGEARSSPAAERTADDRGPQAGGLDARLQRERPVLAPELHDQCDGGHARAGLGD